MPKTTNAPTIANRAAESTQADTVATVVINDRIPVVNRDGSRGYKTLTVDNDALILVCANGLLQAIQTGSQNKHVSDVSDKTGKAKMARTLDAIIAPLAHRFTLDHDTQAAESAIGAIGHKAVTARHLASAIVAAPIPLIRESVVSFIASREGRAWLKANS